MFVRFGGCEVLFYYYLLSCILKAFGVGQPGPEVRGVGSHAHLGYLLLRIAPGHLWLFAGVSFVEHLLPGGHLRGPLLLVAEAFLHVKRACDTLDLLPVKGRLR